MKTINIIRYISEIILIWTLLLYGWMKMDATAACMELKAPEAVITWKYGAVCITTVGGTQYYAPLSVLREKSEKQGK